MKFKNLIKQDMRTRSTLSEQLNPAERDGFVKQSRCWANMPTELLLEVLMRVEASESAWPNRKTVIACAGVCTTWRAILKHLVQTPELSATITFPIAVKQPGPRDCLVHCFIKRNRSTQTYILYLNLTSGLTDDGKFLLAARKCRRPTCTDYIISLRSDEMSKAAALTWGKLRSNFLGSKFIIFDGQPPHPGAKLARSHSTRLFNLKQVSPRVPAGNYPVGHISYELNVLGSRGPRRMNCNLDAIPASSIEPEGVAPTQTELSLSNVDFFPSLPFFRSRSSRVEAYPSGPLASKKDGALVLRNKSPRWHEQLQCWYLNFQGRVTVASVKNFQLVASKEDRIARTHHEKVILQFGKVGKDLFTMDYRYPISAFQAFAICLSSFDSKIACE